MQLTILQQTSEAEAEQIISLWFPTMLRTEETFWIREKKVQLTSI